MDSTQEKVSLKDRLKNQYYHLYIFGRIVGKTRTAELIDMLKNVRKIGYYRPIEIEVGYGENKLVGSINRLRNHGITFYANIDYLKIGLIRYFIFTPDKMIDFEKIPQHHWLRSYALTTSPMGTIVTYTIPYKYKEELREIIRANFRKYVKKKLYEAIMYFEYLQPSFTKYVFENHPLIVGYSVADLKKIYEESSYSSSERVFDEKAVQKPSDSVDLILLKEYEKHAFTPMKDISKMLGTPTENLRRHLLSHIVKKNIVKGIFIKSSFFIKISGTPVYILIRAKDEENLHTLVRFFKSLNIVNSIGYSIDSDDEHYVYVVLYRTLKRMDDLKSFLIDLYKAGEVKEIMFIDYLLSSTRKFTLPYKGFYPDKKDWDITPEIPCRYFEKRYPMKCLENA